MLTSAINSARSHGVSLETLGGELYCVDVNPEMRVYEVWVFTENDDFALLIWGDKKQCEEHDWYSTPEDAVRQAAFPRATLYDNVICSVLDAALAVSEWASSNCDSEGYVRNPLKRAVSKAAWSVYSWVACNLMRGSN